MFADFDKKKLQRNFEERAQGYDNAAPIQRLAAKKLCEIAAPFIQEKLNADTTLKILDLGSGTGFITQEILKQVQDDLEIFETDLAFKMLTQSPTNSKKIQADFENLPFKNNSFDILISSFSLQWITNFEKNFSQFFSLLKPNGLFIFCLPTDGSLEELKAANIFNFNRLPKIDELKISLKKSGFNEKFFTSESGKQNFASGIEALKSLKKIGANYSAKNKKIITKTNLAQFNNFCLKNFSCDNRKIETSWLISYFVLSKNV